MPTVLRLGAIRVRVQLPPREHGPAHVHVVHPHGEVTMELATKDKRQAIRKSDGLSVREIGTAFRIVEEHADFLLRCWRKHHG